MSGRDPHEQLAKAAKRPSVQKRSGTSGGKPTSEPGAMRAADDSAATWSWAIYRPGAGTESRTYKCRCECDLDAEILRSLIAWSCERFELKRASLTTDASLQFTLKHERASLSMREVQWLFSQVDDCHIALESLRLASEYDEERQEIDRCAIAAVSVNAKKRAKVAEGLKAYAQFLEIGLERVESACNALT